MVFAILKQSSLDFRLLRPSGARNDNEKTSLGLKAERGARNDNENWNRDCFASLAMTIIDYCRAKTTVDNLGLGYWAEVIIRTPVILPLGQAFSQ